MKSKLSLEEIQAKLEKALGDVALYADSEQLDESFDLEMLTMQYWKRHWRKQKRLVGYWQWRERVYYEHCNKQTL